MTPDPMDMLLPYEGTIGEFRQAIADGAYEGQTTLTELNAQRREFPDSFSPEEWGRRNRVAVGCANYGWALVGVLGYLARTAPDLLRPAAAIAEDIMVNGGNSWCDDVLYPPSPERPTAPGRSNMQPLF